MKKLLVALGGILLMTGCAHTNYRLVVYNGTDDQIDGTRVSLHDGRSLLFGVMDPGVDAGIYPVKGPLGDVASVEWIDGKGITNDAAAAISPGLRDDSVIFLINPGNTITVQTGRDLYKPRLQVAGE
jgi:hypothetical protein